MLLLVPVHVADGEAHRGQRVAACQRRSHRMLLLEGEPFLGVLVLVDGRDAALELGDAAIVEGHLMRRHRRQMGVGQTRGIVPYAVGDLVALVAVLAADLLPGGRRRRRARGELVDGVTVVQLRVTGDVVMTRVAALRRVLDRQHVEIRAAVVLGVARAGAIRLGGGRPSVLAEAVRLLQLLGRLENKVDAVGALVIDAAAAHRFREIHDHRPGHSGQVAQITLRPFAHHLAGEKRGVGVEEPLPFDKRSRSTVTMGVVVNRPLCRSLTCHTSHPPFVSRT